MLILIHNLVLGDIRFLNESLDIYVWLLIGGFDEYEDVKIVWYGHLYGYR